MSNLVIGIEGLVGAGKTSICRELIKQIPNTILVNGGNLYRAIVATLIGTGINFNDLKKNANELDIKEIMDSLNIEIKIEDNETVIYVDGKKIDEDYIQSTEISMAVSILGGKTKEEKLFEFARDIINTLKKDYNVILSARGIMTIFPECDYHLFITADLDIRVKRKHNQYINETEEKIKENIIIRDELQKNAGYYDLNEKTKVIDVTECKSIKESTEKVLEFINIAVEV